MHSDQNAFRKPITKKGSIQILKSIDISVYPLYLIFISRGRSKELQAKITCAIFFLELVQTFRTIYTISRAVIVGDGVRMMSGQYILPLPLPTATGEGGGCYRPSWPPPPPTRRGRSSTAESPHSWRPTTRQRPCTDICFVSVASHISPKSGCHGAEVGFVSPCLALQHVAAAQALESRPPFPLPRHIYAVGFCDSFPASLNLCFPRPQATKLGEPALPSELRS